MARIKFYNKETGKWEYADKALSVNTDSTSEPMKSLTFTGAVNATYDGSEEVTVDIPQGGGGGSEMEEIFRLTTTEEVTMIETGIDLSQYAEVVAMCKTLPIEGTTANTHFDWYVSKGYAQRIMHSLHNTQERVQVAHITRLSSKKAICRLGYGITQGSLFTENTILGSAKNNAEIDEGRYIRIVLDNLNSNFKFGSYGGNTPLIIGTEVLIYGRK